MVCDEVDGAAKEECWIFLNLEFSHSTDYNWLSLLRTRWSLSEWAIRQLHLYYAVSRWWLRSAYPAHSLMPMSCEWVYRLLDR